MENESKNKTFNKDAKPEKTEIVGVRFRDAGKVYYFAPGNLKIESGSSVIVETARGLEYGFVAEGNSFVHSSKIVPPLRPVVRIADEKDTERYEANKQLEAEAFEICRQKILDHGLEMKLIEAEYTFDNSKLLFYFSAEVRVDFRELVKDLASVFRTRIELRQIGIRDEAKMLGGLGVCGRPFCCSSFLSDFVQVSIKMAKEQNLSLNSSKISGTCGRLMCCLRYEHETYEEEIAKTPPVDSTVKTADGVGTVVEISPLTGIIRVKFGDNTTKSYHRDTVTVIKGNHREKSAD
ncbi:MAG: stage 0 sporulation protein [Ruminococcaceae bacterium]|nr:stage 0 sporulation protein [Oscillospiraceae bacterium]